MGNVPFFTFPTPLLTNGVVRPAQCRWLKKWIVRGVEPCRRIQDAGSIRHAATTPGSTGPGCPGAHCARIEDLVDGVPRILEVKPSGTIKGTRDSGNDLSAQRA